MEIAKFEKGDAEDLAAVNDSPKLAVEPSAAVAVQTQFVVQTMLSSYFPVTVPLSQSPLAERSSAELLHAHVQRYPSFAAHEVLQVTEYPSQTVQDEGVLVTETVGAANAESGIASVATAVTAFMKARMKMDEKY